MTKKKKILMIGDHPLSVSGVGTQSRYLIEGLLRTGKYQFRCLGAAIKHSNYDLVPVQAPNGEWEKDDWLIKPIDGFGNKDMIRMLLVQEKPDAILLFTDPRFFGHIFSMEDEIHQVCPITWWHVWDNDPWPFFLEPIYESVDLINCHSHKTYGMVKEHYPNKTNFIPHAIPENIFFPIENKEEVLKAKKTLLGEDREDHFVGLWINRNARRKMPNDLLDSWKIFLDELERKHGHKKATLVMHTDPKDQEGPNLLQTVKLLGLENNIKFSSNRLEFNQMNILHNISDFYINISCNEGFGLGTLEAMMCAKPIIALKTGGMTYQVMNPDGTENGIALEPDARNLVGSQTVPFIYEDHINNHNVANSMMQMYDFGQQKRYEIGQQALKQAKERFALRDTVNNWDLTLSNCIEDWRKNKQRWSLTEVE